VLRLHWPGYPPTRAQWPSSLGFVRGRADPQANRSAGCRLGSGPAATVIIALVRGKRTPEIVRGLVLHCSRRISFADPGLHRLILRLGAGGGRWPKGYLEYTLDDSEPAPLRGKVAVLRCSSGTNVEKFLRNGWRP
jgi:hypothetical protein